MDKPEIRPMCPFKGCNRMVAYKGTRNGVRRYRPTCFKHRPIEIRIADSVRGLKDEARAEAYRVANKANGR